MREALEQAIEIVGGQTALGRVCGKKQGTVWYWLHRCDGRVPAETVLVIEQATGGVVPRHALRPDIYPPLDQPPPP
jgi:DNA-binding transcriptional regulator YdaS (Cro superfamily)